MTQDGTATAPTNYVAIPDGTLTIPAGSTTGTINVTVNGGALNADLNFSVVLSSRPTTRRFAPTRRPLAPCSPSRRRRSPAGRSSIPQVRTNPSGASVYTANETAFQGVAIQLTGTSSVTNAAVTLNTTTASDGTYSFGNLTPGTYMITETEPTGYADYTAVAGGTGASMVSGNQISLVIPAAGGLTDTNNNFVVSGAAPGTTGSSQRGLLASSGSSNQGPIVISSPTASAFDAASGASPAAVAAAATPASNVTQSGSTVTITGTGGNDTFSFTSGSALNVTFDGASYQFNPATVKSIVFNGSGMGSVTLTDTTGTATTDVGLGYGSMTGAGFTVSVKNVTSIAVNGTGSDKAVVHDSTLHDHLFASGNLAMLTNNAGLSTSIDDFAAATIVQNSTGTLTKDVRAIDFALTGI